jgi:hypothetical protein
VNISEGGILLEGSGGASVGEELNLEFVLPQVGSRLRVHAKVVRKEAPDRIALQFRDLDAQSQLAIGTYISGQVKS